MKIVRKGVTRIVFLVGGYAAKIPNFLVQHNHFLKGCCANWAEYRYTKLMKEIPELYGKVAPTYFCTWFGLLSIQKRVIELNRELTDEEVYFFRYQTTDIKKENFGLIGTRVVCLDYGGE